MTVELNSDAPYEKFTYLFHSKQTNAGYTKINIAKSLIL